MEVKEFLQYPVVGRGQLAPLKSRQDVSDYLAAADQVISGQLVPLMSNVNSGFFVRYERQNIVAGQSEYDIPYRAIGRAVRDVKLVSTGSYRYSLTETSIEELHDTMTGSPRAFYFSGDTISLYPSVSDTYGYGEILEIWYRLRPSKLIEASSAARVSSVSGDDVVVTSLGSLNSGDSIDFVSGRSGHRLLDLDIPITGITDTTISFAANSVPGGLKEGDWISPAGSAPVLTMIPEEAIPYLSSLTLMNLLESQGDLQGAQSLMTTADTQRSLLTSMLSPRNDGPAKKVRGRNPLFKPGF